MCIHFTFMYLYKHYLNICAGFSGELCNFEYNECESNPCLNGGQCSDHIGEFSCKCTAGYTGNRCHIKVNISHICLIFKWFLFFFYISTPFLYIHLQGDFYILTTYFFQINQIQIFRILCVSLLSYIYTTHM